MTQDQLDKAADLVARASYIGGGGSPSDANLTGREAVEAMTSHLLKSAKEEGRSMSHSEAHNIAVGCARRSDRRK